MQELELCLLKLVDILASTVDADTNFSHEIEICFQEIWKHFDIIKELLNKVGDNNED